MTVNRTTLLDLPLPVTGTESGTWGDTTNNGLTQYLDIAIAGSLVLSADSDTTLSSTEGDSSATNIGGTTAQYAVLRCTGARTTTRNINAPAWTISGGTISNYSKTYVVINDTTGGQSIVLRATNSATPTYTTGVTIVAGERAVCAWNGSDFVKVGGAAGGTNTQVQYNNNGVFGGVSGATTNGTAITFSTTNLKLQGSSTGVSSFASANSSATDYTVTFPAASTTIPVATQTLTFSGPTAARTITLPDANFTAARTDSAQTFTGVQTFSSNPVLSGGTANGVLYLNGSSVATSGNALTFDGTTFAVNSAASIGSSTAKTKFYSDSTYNGIFNGASVGSNESIYMGSGIQFFYASGSEQMRLTNTGLGIGGGGNPATGCTLDVQGTSALKMPVGTTAQRPTGVTGMQRFNTTTGFVEYYNGGSWVSPAYNGTTKAIFGYGYTSVVLSMTNLVSNVGVVASDVTGVGTARNSLAAASYGGDKAIFGYGTTGSNVSMTNLVSNAGVVASDVTGVGTARNSLAAASYGGDKAIFGYGYTGSNVSMTNLVSNAGVVATDTTGVGTARYSLAAAGYGGDKAIFGYGYTTGVVSMTNLVSNTGVVATDTTGVGTARSDPGAAGYGGDKAIFGYGYAGSVTAITNLVSNTGVVATDTTGVGTARYGLAAAGYGTDKAIFGYGYTTGVVSVTNLVSNTGVVSSDVTGVGTARRYLAAAGYAS